MTQGASKRLAMYARSTLAVMWVEIGVCGVCFCNRPEPEGGPFDGCWTRF
jgi:hypothetical protein